MIYINNLRNLFGLNQVVGSDRFKDLPDELIINIFSYLQTSAAEVALVSKRFKTLIDDEQLYKARFPKFAVNAEKLKTYLGDPGEEKRLPRRIHKDLEELPIDLKNKVMLTWIPASINKVPVTIKSIEDFVNNPKKGNKTCYRYILPEILEQQGKLNEEKPIKGHWILLIGERTNVFTETIGKTFNEQQKIINKHKNPDVKQKVTKELPFSTPRLIDVIFSVMMKYVIEGQREFSDSPCWYTSVAEQVKYMGDHQIVVGCFSAGGLIVTNYHPTIKNIIGLAGALTSNEK